MSIFDGYADAPFQIKSEGETITLTFKQGVPSTGFGTAEWNIPGPAQGCGAAEDGRGAYCGMLITISSTPQQTNDAPVDGTFYTNDPTADPDKHVGDRIGNALVVGAFYEGEKRGQGLELTTSLVISDLQPNTPYFVAGYAVDCQGRYHTDGNRAFSDQYGNVEEPGTPSTQVVQMNAGEGVLPTDGTNLIPGQIYEFDVEVNSNFPDAAGPNDVLNVQIDGTDAQTYQDLVDEINKQLTLADNPPQSPVPPNTGSYLVDSTNATLQQFNGTTYDPLTALFELTDPAVITTGEYWYNPVTKELNQWDTPLVGVWNPTLLIEYPEDPNTPQCDDYWFDGTQAYKYNGSVWCEVDTYVQTDDPSDAPGGSCGLFWYNTTSMILSEWNESTLAFDATEAVTWNEAPNALTNGTLWYDDVNNKLYEWMTSAFVEIPELVITSVTPQTPENGLYWFDPEHDTLRIATAFPGPGGVFVDVPFIQWHTDPSVVESCSLWWDDGLDVLNVWDVTSNTWVPVATFVQQATDPTLAVEVPLGSIWNNPTTGITQYWDDTQWIEISIIENPTNPSTAMAIGTAWLNTSDGTLSTWGPTWSVIDPIDTEIDPTTISQGAYWFDITTMTLNQRVGTAWVPVPYTTQPIVPIKGSRWYDSINDILYEWNGSRYVPADPRLSISLDHNGDLVLTTSETGSCAATMLLVPGGLSYPAQYGTGNASFHSYGHYYSHTEGPFVAPPLPTTNVTEEGFLFNNIPGLILSQTYGEDGLNGQPMYSVVGIGTDGTPDERRELADSLRAQLGYPVVEVELTPYQIETAIQGAIESLRKRSDMAYRRGFYFIDVKRREQVYQLTNKKAGYDKIVGVMAAYRFTAAFLSSAHGSGIYGQIVLQHLYNMGTFDLTSFHLVAQYIEQMEHLFATRITFNWNEDHRTLNFHQSFTRPERILLDCYVERTEQQLLKDRFCKSWIERYALSLCRITLAEIRGKFGSLPGAGGGISLNGSDLMARAIEDMQELYQQLDDQIVGHAEEWGMGSTFTIG